MDEKEKSNIKSKKWRWYVATVGFNFEEIERVSNIISFMNKYNWEGTNYPLKIDDWKNCS